MRARILRRLSVMFDETDIKSARASSKHKRYADRSVIHRPVLKEGEYVLVQRPTTAAKNSQEQEDHIAHSKLRYEMAGPYRVISSTPETVTVEYNEEHVTVSNDICIHNPKREPEDPDRQGDADDITKTDDTAQTNQPPTPSDDPVSSHGDVNNKLISEQKPDSPDDDELMPTYQYFKRRQDTPVNEQSETVLRQDPDPDTVCNPSPSPIARVLNFTRCADGTVTHRVQLDDSTYRNDVPEEDIPKPLLEPFDRQTRALTEQPTTIRKRSRPRRKEPPLQMPQHHSSQPPSFLVVSNNSLSRCR